MTYGWTRDRLTWVVYASLGVYGYFIYGFGPTVPLLGDAQGTSRAVSALHSSALAVGAIVAGLAFAGLAGRAGRGRVLRYGLVGLGAGIVVYAAGTVFPLTLLGALLCGTCGSLVVNATAPILTAHHRDSAPAAISEANAWATGTGTVAPLIVGVGVAVGFGWQAGMLVALVGVAVVLALSRRVSFPDPEATPGQRQRSRPVPRRFWAAWTILVLCIGVEFSVTVWASDLVRQRLEVTSGAASGTLTAVIAGMTVGRVIGARLMALRSLESLLLAALGVAASGFLLLWTSSSLAVALLGLFVLGLGMGAHYPLSISRAIAASDNQPDLASGRASVGAGLAVGTAPFLLGWLADTYGVHTAFLVVPVLLGSAALILLMSRTERPLTMVRTAIVVDD